MDSASNVDARSLRNWNRYGDCDDHANSDGDIDRHLDVDSESDSIGHCFRYSDVPSHSDKYLRSHQHGHTHIDRDDHTIPNGDAFIYTRSHKDTASITYA